MLYSLKDFTKRISPVPIKDGFHHFITGSYKLNFFETLSGLKIVLTTDVNVGDIQQDLRDLHRVSPNNAHADIRTLDPLATCSRS